MARRRVTGFRPWVTRPREEFGGKRTVSCSKTVRNPPNSYEGEPLARVSAMTAPSAEANRRAQAEMYGEPLGDLIGQCAAALGLTQLRVAELLGISAPMLSQLVNAHRIKIGNPAAVHRLQAMYVAAQRVAAGELSLDEAVRELEANRKAEGVVTHTTTATDTSSIRSVFRAAGSAEEFGAAARLLDASHPGIAGLLRTYGGPADG